MTRAMSPPPLAGGGWGRGAACPPPPNPLPQGEGEHWSPSAPETRQCADDRLQDQLLVDVPGRKHYVVNPSSTRPIDCDIHPAVPSTRLLLPYLDDYWREHIIRRGIEADNLELSAYPVSSAAQ